MDKHTAHWILWIFVRIGQNAQINYEFFYNRFFGKILQFVYECDIMLVSQSVIMSFRSAYKQLNDFTGGLDNNNERMGNHEKNTGETAA